MSDPREEAERLVAAALAALSVAADGTKSFATGSAECCVCPICKAIAATRDPDPEFVERLATGAGDLATGVAGLLRAFGGGWGAPEPPAEPETPAAPQEPEGEADDVWQSATREPKS
jgi:hypothetical protein